MQNVNFGNVDVLPGTAVDVTATLQVTCSGFTGSGGRLCISIGVGSNGDATSRQMLNPPSATVRYDLFTSSARTTVWGSWETGYKSPGVQANVSNGTSNFTVFGRFFGSQQTATPGSYIATFTSNPFVRYRNIAGAGNCPTSGAQTVSTSFNANVTVTTSCNVNAANMNFGSVALLTSNIDAVSSLNVTCSNSTAYTVSLSNGNTGTSPTNRKMVSGSASVTYGLYRDASRTQPWGSTIGTNTLAGTGTGTVQALTVYGRVPPQAAPAPATYSDLIVVTVTY